jgi:ketosteroid isomerase-like protein
MQSGLQLVHEIIAALNRGDVDGMLERTHPDFEWWPRRAPWAAACTAGTSRCAATSRTGSAPSTTCGSSCGVAIGMEEYATRALALAEVQ